MKIENILCHLVTLYSTIRFKSKYKYEPEVEYIPKKPYPSPIYFDSDLIFANTDYTDKTYTCYDDELFINIDEMYNYDNYTTEYIVTVFDLERGKLRVFRMFKVNSTDEQIQTSGNTCGIVFIDSNTIEFYGIDYYDRIYTR